MVKIRISQKTALLIERLLSLGCSDEKLINLIEQNDSKLLEKYADDDYSFETFLSYAKEHSEDIVSAIQNGYQITFNTMGGLRYWIENAFGLKEELDFKAEEGKKLGLKLTADQIDKLRYSLASNWVVVEKNNEIDLIIYSIWIQENN